MTVYMNILYQENIELLEIDRKHIAGLTIINTNDTDALFEAADKYLSREEVVLLNNMKSIKRKQDFVLGRVSAKLSILNLKKKVDPKSISIDNGCYRQPYIKASNITNCQISITHSKLTGAAIAFPEEVSMGIDLEKIDENKEKCLMNQLTEHEKKEVIQCNRDIRMLTVVWTAKEAVSKMLKLGFSCSVKLYEVNRIEIANQSIECSFIHFPLIKTKSYYFNNYIITLAMPSNMNIMERNQNFKRMLLSYDTK